MPLSVTTLITDQDVAAIAAEIATMAEPRPTVEAFVAESIARQVIAPIVARQRQYSLDRAIARVSNLLPKLVQLSAEQQDHVKTLAEAAVDQLIAENNA